MMLIRNIEKIKGAVRDAPLVRRFAFAGFEVELDRTTLDRIKRDTEKTFTSLIKETNSEIKVFSEGLFIADRLESAAWAIINSFFGQTPIPPASQLRFTVHIPDVIFQDFLYQLTEYFHPASTAGGRKAGRRFSSRYGIIGLAWRTFTSRGVGAAFQGSAQRTQQLIEHWSMTPGEAQEAKKKPSCIAVMVKDEIFKKPRGLIYFDSELVNLFGNDQQAAAFSSRCESIQEVVELGNALLELERFSSQLKIGINLAELVNNEHNS
ncbi:hypothetical protein M8312_06610 [Sphingomonas sp. KRR8]|uniref:hypothetical protein n=1 Tax=Sphingomonas sp. KRR8 TaxID=2942996 RepID=UPI002022292A|nr:hypothetical protein [Sphingomonas sp. KRR8]URD62170.1 hypothetical protein M8312_06610 [Sphingomonas sp. KRR8]